MVLSKRLQYSFLFLSVACMLSLSITSRKAGGSTQQDIDDRPKRSYHCVSALVSQFDLLTLTHGLETENFKLLLGLSARAKKCVFCICGWSALSPSQCFWVISRLNIIFMLMCRCPVGGTVILFPSGRTVSLERICSQYSVYMNRRGKAELQNMSTERRLLSFPWWWVQAGMLNCLHSFHMQPAYISGVLPLSITCWIPAVNHVWTSSSWWLFYTQVRIRMSFSLCQPLLHKQPQ